MERGYDFAQHPESETTTIALSDALVDLEEELQKKSRELIPNLEEVLRVNLLPGPLDIAAAKAYQDGTEDGTLYEGREHEEDEEAHRSSEENGRCLLVHNIDWDAPPTWGDDVIPKMPATAIFTYLKDTYGLYGTIECLWNGCGQQVNVAMSLKNHLHCDSHINLRRRCPRCSWTVRPDMWNSRYPNHVCGENLASKKG
ncbi:hypothetical protein C8Q73DRAFT_784092 [Cubamyces lactineus]|nr:hypothetical protein C8Q73DRAFT_784092 [Cubamyces lactineus]